MVTVFKPQVTEEYQWAIPVDKYGYKVIWNMINQKHGRRVGDSWVPVRVFLWEGDNERGPLRRADMPWFSSGALVVTTRAKDALMEVLDDDAELLSLLNDTEDLWLVNAWREIDALDEERSELKRFSSSGRVMEITRYVFREDRVRGIACFKIPQLSNVMFVTDAVVAAAQEAGLTGVIFRPVWKRQLYAILPWRL